MTGIYFSGTGNTRRCVEQFVNHADKNAKCFSIEDTNAVTELSKHETIVFGFPVYYSNLPKISKDFITTNAAAFKGKKVFIIATKALHNAYGMGYAREMFKNCGVNVIGTLQINMPENIRDLMITMLYTGEKLDNNMLKKAEKKIERAAAEFKKENYANSGLSPLNYTVGKVLEALPFYPKTDSYISAPKVSAEKCNGCGKCVKLCPMKNISIEDNHAKGGDKCTICYRCCNICPKQALTVLGKKVYGQYNIT